MVTYFVTPELVLILSEDSEKKDYSPAVQRCLLTRGFCPWGAASIERFVGGGLQLIIARPLPPRRCRISRGVPRLQRRS